MLKKHKNNWNDPKYRKGINVNVGATEGHRLDRNIAALKGQIAGAKEAQKQSEPFDVLTQEKGKLEALIKRHGSLAEVKKEAAKRNATYKLASSRIEQYTKELKALEDKKKTL